MVVQAPPPAAPPTAPKPARDHSAELERGTEEYNLQLGSRRAEVAKQYLVALGVEADRIETISYGEERPADPEHNEAGWPRTAGTTGRSSSTPAPLDEVPRGAA